MWVLAVMVFFWGDPHRRILHIGKFTHGSYFCVSVKPSWSYYFCLGPSATGDETATEGEAHVRAFVFAPSTERHHNDSAVVFRAILKSLLRYALCSLFRVVTLVNEVTDLLTVHDEVNAVSGECQKGVVDVVQWNPLSLWFCDDTWRFEVKISNAAGHGQSAIDMRLTQTVPRNTTSSLPYSLFFILSLRRVILSEFEGFSFAAQHGSAVPHTAHHQLDPISQQGHSGRGPCTQQRGCNTPESEAQWLVCDAMKVTETV